jgi:hypothetical protein
MKIRHLLPIALLVLVAGIARAQGPGPAPERVFDMNAGIMVHCGIDRWEVKTLTDPDSIFINVVSADPCTVTAMSEWPSLDVTKNLPRQPREEFPIRVIGLLYAFRLETDGDIRILLRDTTAGSTIGCEVPDPACPEVGTSSQWHRYAAVRKWLTDSVGTPTSSLQYLPSPRLVIVTGMPFADPAHGQTGTAANNWEIHPVLSIEGVGSRNVEEPKVAPEALDLSSKDH